MLCLNSLFFYMSDFFFFLVDVRFFELFHVLQLKKKMKALSIIAYEVEVK